MEAVGMFPGEFERGDPGCKHIRHSDEHSMMVSRRQFLRVTGVCAASVLLPVAPRYGYAAEMGESRAIFDESLSWVTERSAHDVCERITRAGFNVLMPCVWHGRGTAWPSKLAPWDSKGLEQMAREIPGFDPLEKLIDVARQYQIEIHPWFNVMLRRREFFPQFYESGTPDNSFDVHNPEFRRFICDLMIECISKYRVHGINLDYIRSVAICNSQSCSQKYRQLTGRSLSADRLMYVLGSEARKALSEWNEQAVSTIVQQVSSYVRKNHPGLVISVCGHPGQPNLMLQGQNSIKWADQGLIDVIYDMRYPAPPNWEEMRAVQQTMKRPEAYVMLAGNYDVTGPKKVPVSSKGSEVAARVAQGSQMSRGNGIGLYIYSLLNDEQIEALRTGPFRSPMKPKWVYAGSASVPPSLSPARLLPILGREPI